MSIIKALALLTAGKQPAVNFEYTEGNGQCDECGGTESTFGWGLPGHSKGCELAKMLADLKYDRVLYSHNNKHAYRPPGWSNHATKADEKSYQDSLVYGV